MLLALRLFCASVFTGVAILACGGAVEGDEEEGLITPEKDSGIVDGSKRDGAPTRDGGTVIVKDGGQKKDANTYVDPVCPNPKSPETAYSCDVATQTGCKVGQSCSPFVDYPSDPCDPEIYGSVCIPAGSGVQGSDCNSQASCAPGYICVITGAGTKCAKYCDLNKPSSCSDGLICDAVDVTGVGVCN